MTECWTWVALDWDLLRDDIDAADNFPVLFWRSAEDAMAAAEKQQRDDWQENTGGTAGAMPPLEWTKHGDDEWIATWGGEYEDSNEVRVYRMREGERV